MSSDWAIFKEDIYNQNNKLDFQKGKKYAIVDEDLDIDNYERENYAIAYTPDDPYCTKVCVFSKDVEGKIFDIIEE